MRKDPELSAQELMQTLYALPTHNLKRKLQLHNKAVRGFQEHGDGSLLNGIRQVDKVLRESDPAHGRPETFGKQATLEALGISLPADKTRLIIGDEKV